MRRRVAEFVGGWCAWVLSQAGPLGVAVRALHLLAVAGAGWLAWSLAPGAPATLAAVVVAGLAVGTAVLPDGVLPALELAVLALWWAAVGQGAGWPWWIGFALLLGLAHGTAAAAASAPLHAGVTARGARAVTLRLGGYLLAVAAAAGLIVLVGLFADVVPRGWWWVALLATLAVAGAVLVARRPPSSP